MIHAICDFCGKDCDRTATLLTLHPFQNFARYHFCGKDCDRTATLLTLHPFQNFARYHTDNKPFGTEDKARSFVICSECGKKHGLPNPHETYSGITDQNVSYEKRLDNYTDSDLMNDRDE